MNRLSLAESKLDTHKHIRRVQEILMGVIQNLQQRALVHDVSKLLPPEAGGIAESGADLHKLTYGSEEYDKALENIQPIIDHHYACNSHHPEHYGEMGINGMDLLDLLEMVCDWKAASERHADGCLFRSLEHSRERFGISEQLQTILTNTAVRYLTEPMQVDPRERTIEERAAYARSCREAEQALGQDPVDTGVTEVRADV